MEVRLDGRAVRVGKIVCVGRNYLDHAREMGAIGTREELARQPPFFFLKPASALVASGGEVVLPEGVGDVHHEVELALLVGRRGKRLNAARALDVVAGHAVFLDLTARDVQAAAKKAGLPWTLAKGMDTFAPCGEFVAPRAGEPDVELRLDINGETRQRGRTTDMIHPLPRLLAEISRHMTLEEGDIIATGTPAGVGPIRPGDRLRATAGDLPPLEVRAVAESNDRPQAA